MSGGREGRGCNSEERGEGGGSGVGMRVVAMYVRTRGGVMHVRRCVEGEEMVGWCW